MNVIQKPIITEKSLRFASRGWYTFAVSLDARKENILKALKEDYKVDAIEIRTIRMTGKTHRVGKKMTTVARSDWKKAMVKLKKGQKLDMYEVTPQAE